MAALQPRASGLLRQEAASIFQASTQTTVGGYVGWDVLRSSWSYIATQSDL